MDNFYNGKVVLITGASMGIGKEVARQIFLRGGCVIIASRNEDRLRKVADEFCQWKDRLLCIPCDVSISFENDKLIEKVIDRFGRLDILITNAGLSCFGELAQTEFVVAKHIIDTNIYGSLYPVMASISELKKTKGHILFVSSIAGFYGLPGYSIYSLSKMSLRALAQSLHVELKSHGIAVSISFPGFTENESDKKTLSPYGEWVNIPSRSRIVLSSRKTTALRMLKQIRGRQFMNTHSFLGNVTKFMITYFPLLSNGIIQWTYSRSNRNKLQTQHFSNADN